MDAFGADALTYAAVPGHPLGQRVAALFRFAAPATMAGIGSVLLLPEVLSKPLRDGAAGPGTEIQVTYPADLADPADSDIAKPRLAAAY